MQTIVKLANDIPWVMAPVTLIAATAIISLAILVIRFLREEARMMVVSTTLIFIIWAIVMRAIIE